jgi:hypothetical protein
MSTEAYYHYTSVIHLPQILLCGYLETTENNIARPKFVGGYDINANRGAGVVWLTTRESVPDNAFGLDLSAADKTEVRITVRLPRREVHKWEKWAKRRGIAPDWLAQQRDATPGFYSQRVIARRIYADEWVDVVNTRTGEIYEIPTVRAPQRTTASASPPGIRTVLSTSDRT